MYQGISIKRPFMQSISQNKVQWATGIALLIHAVGLMGMLWIETSWFARMTPLNLMIMFSLVVWTQSEKKRNFYIFLVFSFLIGMISEIIGVQTGLLFGNYAYGAILGFQFAQVPLIIGLNWFVVIFSAVATIFYFTRLVGTSNKLKSASAECAPIEVNILIGAAFLATFFDWVMEPVAVKLGFWTWEGEGQIPFLNYLSWFFISIIMMSIFRFLRIRPDNLFAVHLLLIQMMFFMILRAFL
jgi:bisanhydrobacterioruberin hydratase